MSSRPPATDAVEDRSGLLGPFRASTRPGEVALAAAAMFFAVVMQSYYEEFTDTKRIAVVGGAFLVGAAAGACLGPCRAIARVPGETPLLLLVVFVATYLCVPETDHYREALIVPVAVLVLELVVRTRLGTEFLMLSVAVTAWASMLGAVARSTAYLGAFYAWWAVVLPVLVDAVVPLRGWMARCFVGVAGGLAVLVVVRTGGIADEFTDGLLAVVVVTPLSLAVAIGGALLLRTGTDA